MTDEQLQLIARILDGLCESTPIEPYYEFGANLGRCSFCGVIGKVHFPDIRYEHKDECILSLNAQLQASLKSKENIP